MKEPRKDILLQWDFIIGAKFEYFPKLTKARLIIKIEIRLFENGIFKNTEELI